MTSLLLSAREVLAFEPIPPPRERHLASSRFRVASESSKLNRQFEHITHDSLTVFPESHVKLFRSYISLLSQHVDFSNVSRHPHKDACPLPDTVLRTEADVRAFVNSYILQPVWSVVLAMLPDNRDYGWTFVNEKVRQRLDKIRKPDEKVSKQDMCTADIAVVQLTRQMPGEWHETVPLLLELKAPCLVYDARKYLESAANNPDDWETMTRQVRKYAVVENCHHHILMDERFALYFYFEENNLADENGTVYYQTAYYPSNDFTIRELLAFAAWNAIPTNAGLFQQAKQKDYSIPNAARPRPTVFPEGYTRVGPEAVAPTPPRPQRRSAPLIVGADMNMTFVGLLQLGPADYPLDFEMPWYFNRTTKTLRLDPLLWRKGDPSYPDDEAYESSLSRSPSPQFQYSSSCTSDRFWNLKPAPPPSESNNLQIALIPPPQHLSVHIESQVKLGVYTMLDNNSRQLYIAKRYRSKDRCYLERELRAYSALRDLQGNGIPRCVGIYRPPFHSEALEESDGDASASGTNTAIHRDHISEASDFYLVTEYIPLPTLASLNGCPRPQSQLLEYLHELLDRIHVHGVVHDDLSNPANILIDPADGSAGVAIIDFGLSNPRNRVPCRRVRQDHIHLQRAWDNCFSEIDNLADVGNDNDEG
ncbi:hypothetical protein BDD12DRAFT_895278 [Trichophaea hybrida]|nr:hypothetical protein BDD12DRAFT_895278 [Trichophaea hybrida]